MKAIQRPNTMHAGACSVNRMLLAEPEHYLEWVLHGVIARIIRAYFVYYLLHKLSKIIFLNLIIGGLF